MSDVTLIIRDERPTVIVKDEAPTVVISASGPQGPAGKGITFLDYNGDWDSPRDDGLYYTLNPNYDTPVYEVWSYDHTTPDLWTKLGNLIDYDTFVGHVDYQLGQAAPRTAVVTPATPPVTSTSIFAYIYAGPEASVYLLDGSPGQSATLRGDISPGTWSARMFYGTSYNFGVMKVEYSLDEGSTWTTVYAGFDLYTSNPQQNAYADWTDSIVVPFGTYSILVRYTNVGINPSSVGYYLCISPIHLLRTS